MLIGYYTAFFGDPLHAGVLAGDINVITLNAGYVLDCLVNPASGIVFWSALVVAGIAGLAFGKERYHRVFLACSLAMIGLYLVRVPVMYLSAGSGPMAIGGVRVAGMDDPIALVRSDMNRYVTLLAPFAMVGLRSLLDAAVRRLRPTPPAS